MKAIKKNLHDSILEKEYARVMMRCENCGSEYSANSGDYWNLPDEYEFKCCGKGMTLVRKLVSYQETGDYYDKVYEIMHDSTVHNWVKKIIPKLEEHDIVDVIHDLNLLTHLFNMRWYQITNKLRNNK